MDWTLTPCTQAVLLLTAPMISGKHHDTDCIIKPGEYRTLEKHLQDRGHKIGDLITGNIDNIVGDNSPVSVHRIAGLLNRGSRLAQVVDHWHTRAIWVISRHDEEYPHRLVTRLPRTAPALLYGCGDITLLNDGGLAVVGPRDTYDNALSFARQVGDLTARSMRTVVSGGARGVDQAAMFGALEANGRSVGVLPNGLENQVMSSRWRNWITEGQMLMVSPYDPQSRFYWWAAKFRNTLIYNLADAALVVEANPERGGSRSGAVNHLRSNSTHKVPVYVRDCPSDGLDALSHEGALLWPNPETPNGFNSLISAVPAEPALW